MQERRTIMNPFDNAEFRKEFNETLDAKLAPVVNKVEQHETYVQRSKGIMAVVGVLWSLVLASLEYLFHRRG